MVLEDLLRNFSFSNPGLVGVLIPAGIAFAFGYGLYVYSIASSYFDTPWYYATGLVASAYAIYNIRMLLSFPAKPPLINGKKSIW